MTASERVLNKAGMGISAGLPLEASDGDLEALRKNVQHLMDLEAIRQLKYAYFRCIDTANLEELATLFHDDVQVHFKGGTYEWKLAGKQEYLDNVGGAFSSKAVGHHNGHHPEIQVLSATEATGIWYLADHMWITEHDFYTYGTALYWDRYVKQDGRWLIRETCYERLYEVNRQEPSPAFSAHYLARAGA